MAVTAKYPGRCFKCNGTFEVGVTLINKDDELCEQKGKSIWVHEMCGPQARAQDAEVSEGYHASKGEVLDKDPIKDFTEEEPW